MMFVWTAFLGWAAVLFLAAGIGIPYLARTLHLKRFWLHYVLGFLIPAVALLHAWLPMSAGRARSTDMIGLLLATAALFVMVSQAAVGITLRSAQGPDRFRLRRTHFLIMTVMVLLVGGHIYLNRA